MRIDLRTVDLKKKYPLSISRGTSIGSRNVFVLASDGECTGVGECAPGTGSDEDLAAVAERQIAEISDRAARLSILEVDALCRDQGIESAAQAGLDVALWDLKAKKAGMPLYALLGLPRRAVQTSVTVGINPPEVVRERVPLILQEWGGRALKIKLGSSEGIDHDKASYEAAREAAAPFGVSLRVDANGGWSASDAIGMNEWLAKRDCEYVEQPLEAGQECDLPAVFSARKIPIFLDETVRIASDVPAIADRCDGVNLKLMKTGGITEALRLVATARAHGLKTMIGCMGESSVAIAGGAALGALFDYIDLDAHFNLEPDPAGGLEYNDGVVLPPEKPGHGAELNV